MQDLVRDCATDEAAWAKVTEAHALLIGLRTERLRLERMTEAARHAERNMQDVLTAVLTVIKNRQEGRS